MRNLTKKLVSILFTAVLLCSTVYAADVGYILKNKRMANEQIMDVFSELGMSVELIEDSKVYQYDLSSYALLFIDDVRFTYTKNLPIYKYPSVIMNKYYGPNWGLTDDDGISQLVSTTPLSVIIPNNGIEQVYTQGLYGIGSTQGIPYYYLSDKNKLDMKSIARNYVGTVDDYDFGDVVAVGKEGTRLVNGVYTEANICFYGIAKTDYWTENARELFIDCIGGVLIQCYDDSDCDDNDAKTVDVCINPGTIDSYCEHNPIVCSTDSECGTEYPIGDKYCVNNKDVYQQYAIPFCENKGTASSECIENTEQRLVEECSDYCLDGECVGITCYIDEECDDSNDHTEDTCVNKGTPESYCKHEDIQCLEDGECGTSGYINNPYCNGPTGRDVWQDFQEWKCINPGTVDSGCGVEVEPMLIEECADNCYEGGCVIITCYDDSDCEDGREYTEDKCINRGTVQSYCTHEDILCSKSTDCGSDRFIGPLYCIADDVYRDYLMFTCNFMGTSFSFCSTAISHNLLYECDYRCSKGYCVRCIESSDCDDGNSNTDDTCWFAGTVDSYCTNDRIACFEDSDCGSDSYAGSPYCNGDNIMQNYRTFDCVNEGTIGSYCDITYTPQLIQNCDNGVFCDGNETCANAKCVIETHVECSYLTNQCNTGTCNENENKCEALPKADGLLCNDGLFCTSNDICSDGICTGSLATDCSDSISCTIDSCNEKTESCEHSADDSYCDNGDFCDGVETCSLQTGCLPGTAVSCTGNNVNIAECTYNPDNILFTWDYYSFSSSCDEASDQCTTPPVDWEDSIIHTCDKQQCGAECSEDADCSPTECNLDDCYGNDYYDYNDVDNSCLGDCTCEENQCGSPTITYNDPRCTECQTDDDCNDLNKDYCHGLYIKHDQGICSDFECTVETTIVENCDDGIECTEDSCNPDGPVCEHSECCIPETYNSEWKCMNTGMDTSTKLSTYVTEILGDAWYTTSSNSVCGYGSYYIQSDSGTGILRLKTPSLPFAGTYDLKFYYGIGSPNDIGTEDFEVVCGDDTYTFLDDDDTSKDNIFRFSPEVQCDFSEGYNYFEFRSLDIGSVHFKKFRIDGEKVCP